MRICKLAAALCLLVVIYISGAKCKNLTNIKLGFLPSITSKNHETGNTGKTYAAAISVAIDALQANPDYDHINFTYIFKDAEYDSETTLKAIVDLYHQGADVFFGPENNCVFSAKLAAALNRPMIGYRCLDSVLSNKLEYPTFARTVPSTAKVTKSILALFSYYKWDSFSVVMEQTSEWEEVSWTLGLAAKRNYISINTNDSFTSNYKVFMQDHYDKICGIAKSSSTETRVYVFLGDHDPMVQFVRCLAKHANISEYAIIHIREFADKFEYTSDTALRRLTNTWIESVQNTTSNTLDYSFRQLITLMHRKSQHDSAYLEFESRVRDHMTQPPFNIIALPGVPLPISLYAAKLYDGVLIYAKAAKKLLESGGDLSDGRLLTLNILNSTFRSIQQFNDSIDAHGDAEGAYSAVAIIKESNSNYGWALKQVGTFRNLEDSNEQLEYLKHEPMSWLGRSPPLPEPACGFTGSRCTKDSLSNLVYLAVVVGASVAIVLTLLGVCYWRQYQQKKRVDSLLWKIDKADIDVLFLDQPMPNFEDEDSEQVEATQKLLQRGNSHSDESEHFEHRKKSLIASRRWTKLCSSENEEEIDRITQLPYCPIGIYKHMLVSLKCVWNSPDVTKLAKEHLYMLRELNHDNINKFVGACSDPPYILIAHQYCERGSLEDILVAKRNLFLEETAMQYSLINDLVKGMVFIHSSPIGFHGDLKSSKCLVDSRFVLQISGFGLHHFRNCNSTYNAIKNGHKEKYWRACLWRAPELLRQPDSFNGTQKGDVYSFSIILHEILALLGPWGGTALDDQVIIMNVKNGTVPVTRPNSANLKTDSYLKECMEECWAEMPESRPDFKVLHSRKLKPLRDKFGSNILENMLERIEKYTKNLESVVEERTHQLITEKKKTDKLLYRMLPRSVADDLKRGNTVQASYFECVTIYFSDIVGFTQLCAESNPYQIVNFLNDLYTKFDKIINNYDVYKVETIGDAYMVVSGLPKRNGDNHAGEIASMSLELLAILKNYKIIHRPGEKLRLRIGIHSGPVVVGVVGIKMPRYCLFGDTVNTASRMESHGLPSRIHCSEQCKNILDKLGGYYLEERGLIDMKGKGQVLTYWLNGEDTICRFRRLSEAVAAESGCNSTRSSFDSLYLMPNGFRKPTKMKLACDQFSIEDFQHLRSFASTQSSLRKSIRRGSMPLNDYKRGSMSLAALETNCRRDSFSALDKIV